MLYLDISVEIMITTNIARIITPSIAVAGSSLHQCPPLGQLPTSLLTSRFGLSLDLQPPYGLRQAFSGFAGT